MVNWVTKQAVFLRRKYFEKYTLPSSPLPSINSLSLSTSSLTHALPPSAPTLFPQMYGLQSVNKKNHVLNAAYAIIDQRRNTSRTAPVLTPHRHARKCRSICANIIACMHISPLLINLFHFFFMKREGKENFIFVLLSTKCHQSWLRKALDVLCEIGSLKPVFRVW